MSRFTEILLREILEAIRLIQGYTSGLTQEQFEGDSEKQDAVIRRLEIIGEAVKGLPSDLRAKYPDVPWRDIAGARDVLVHEYFRVDLGLTWAMVQNDLPDLAAAVELILEKEGFGDFGAR